MNKKYEKELRIEQRDMKRNYEMKITILKKGTTN